MLHQPHTGFRAGGIINAACPCGWTRIASSHEHSCTLGREHVAEVTETERLAGR